MSKVIGALGETGDGLDPDSRTQVRGPFVSSSTLSREHRGPLSSIAMTTEHMSPKCRSRKIVRVERGDVLEGLMWNLESRARLAKDAHGLS